MTATCALPYDAGSRFFRVITLDSWFGWEELKFSAAHVHRYLPAHPALLLPWSPTAGHRLRKVPDFLCEDIVRSAEVRVVSW